MNFDAIKSLRLYLLLLMLSCAWIALQLLNRSLELEVFWLSRRWTGGVLLAVLFTLLFALLLGFSFTQRGRAAFQRLGDFHVTSRPAVFAVRLLTATYLLAAALLMAWLVYGSSGDYHEAIDRRLTVFTLLVVGGALLLRLSFPRQSFIQTLAFSTVLLACGYLAAMFIPDVSTYPLSLGWSEASRYYFASLFFSERIYGHALPPPVLHPSRYLLQAVPFVVDGLPLWFHRLWQVLLWLTLPFATVVLLGRQLKIEDRWRFWMFVLWAFLFCFQGPIYYHLTLCALIVLLGYDRHNFTKTLVFVVLASLWAGISRINWVPVPGALAAALYLLETPVAGRPFWRYVLPPSIWLVAGSLAGLGSQFLYAIWSGNQLEQFGTSLTSDLLWYRLFPNVTYHTGILPTILVVSLPLLLIIVERLQRLNWRLHWVRLWGLVGLLLVFFAGGLVVSVKIGGGNNLHNLDAYLFFLLVIGSYFFFGRVAAESPPPGPLPRPFWGLVVFALLLPVVYTLQSGGSADNYWKRRVDRGLEKIQEFVAEARAQDGEVLFIAERHLLTFGNVQDVPLADDYERTFLMEMAMSHSMPYLERFYDDLANHRFALIITQPLNLQIKGADEIFGEENDAWVTYVAVPIACYYDSVDTMRDVNLQFLRPRPPDSDPPEECGELPFLPQP
jgi:hypothetical protein